MRLAVRLCGGSPQQPHDAAGSQALRWITATAAPCGWQSGSAVDHHNSRTMRLAVRLCGGSPQQPHHAAGSQDLRWITATAAPCGWRSGSAVDYRNSRTDRHGDRQPAEPQQDRPCGPRAGEGSPRNSEIADSDPLRHQMNPGKRKSNTACGCNKPMWSEASEADHRHYPSCPRAIAKRKRKPAGLASARCGGERHVHSHPTMLQHELTSKPQRQSSFSPWSVLVQLAWLRAEPRPLHPSQLLS